MESSFMKSSLKVHINSSSHDCDCCGFFSVATANIMYNGESYEFHHDGHFGNGYWNGDDDTLNLFLIATVLGKTAIAIDHPEYTQFIGPTDGNVLAIVYEELEDALKVTVNHDMVYHLPYSDEFYEHYELDGVQYKTMLDDNISLYLLKDILSNMNIELTIETNHEDCYTGYYYGDDL